jgi:hypothetical protein
MKSTKSKTYRAMNNLPMNPPALVRQVSVGAFRARIGSEQYFRVLSESGDILLIDYTRDCRTVLELKPGTVYPHAFYNQVYYGDKTSLQLQFVDLATGNVLPDWEYDDASNLTLKPGCVSNGDITIISPMEGDLGVAPTKVYTHTAFESM